MGCWNSKSRNWVSFWCTLCSLPINTLAKVAVTQNKWINNINKETIDAGLSSTDNGRYGRRQNNEKKNYVAQVPNNGGRILFVSAQQRIFL